MRTMNEAFLCCGLRFRCWKKDYKVILIFLSVFILIFYYTRDVYYFSMKIQEPIGPWLFLAIFSDYIVSMGLLKIMLYFGIVVLFCNAPFIDRLYIFIVLRSGRKSWSLGQVLYIFISALIYTTFIFLCSVAAILPRITFTAQWGKTIGTLAMTDAANQTPLLIFPWKVIKNYSPVEAVIIEILLVWLTCVMIGLILFCMNSMFNRKIGISLCCLIILVDPVVKWIDKVELLCFSPISWSSLENLATNDMSSMYRPVEGVMLLLLICVLLAVIAVLYHKNQPFEKNMKKE